MAKAKPTIRPAYIWLLVIILALLVIAWQALQSGGDQETPSPPATATPIDRTSPTPLPPSAYPVTSPIPTSPPDSYPLPTWAPPTSYPEPGG